MDAIGKVKKGPCPIVLVGMQKQGPLQVTPNEVTHRAADLGLPYFHVQAQNYAQVMGPFAHLARRHIQAKAKRTGLSRGIIWFRQSLRNISYLWIWSCFKRQQYRIERLEDPNTSEATVYEFGGQPFTDSKHQHRRSSASDAWTTVITDEQPFYYNKTQHRHFYVLENPDDRAVLQHYRRQNP